MKLIDIYIDCLSLIFNHINIENKLILHKSNKNIYNNGICNIQKNYTNLFIYWCRKNKIYYNQSILDYWGKIDNYKKKCDNIYIWKRNCNWRENNIFKFPSIENLKYTINFTGNWGILSVSDYYDIENKLVLQSTYRISYDKKIWRDFNVLTIILYIKEKEICKSLDFTEF